MEKIKDEAAIERYKYNFRDLLHEVKAKFPYFDGKLGMKILEEEIGSFLGGKNSAELQESKDRDEHNALKKKKKEEKNKFKEGDRFNELTEKLKEYDKLSAENKDKANSLRELKKSKIKANKVEEGNKEEEVDENLPIFKIMTQGRNLITMINSEENMQKHLDFTKGKVFTRFPPEPNGYIHIGHAKSLRFNFGNAAKAGGHCYLRYDDTNPEKETDEFIKNIEESVRWLGYTPYKITHASDYFSELHALAVELIKRGKAYICHLNKEEVSEGRKKMIDSPYRNRSIEENLKLFEMMRQGRMDTGEVNF